MSTISKIETPNVFSLEAEKSQLEVALAQGGQYIQDGYGCVDWEPMSDYHKKVVKKRLAKIENDLCKLYKLPDYIIA